MVRIGEFALIGQVTVQALRHYDRLGLLKPAEVDSQTGYRYYALRQLPRLYRILALKDLGLSLEEIASLMEEGFTADELRGVLRFQRLSIEDEARDLEDRLKRVDGRLKLIEMGEGAHSYDPIRKVIPSQSVLTKRAEVPDPEQIPGLVRSLFDDLSAAEREGGYHQNGPALSLWYTDEEGKEIEVEAAIPIAESGNGLKKLPGIDALSVIHQGSFQTVPRAYEVGLSWMDLNKLTLAGPIREVYVEYDRNGPHDQYVTEIQFPLSEPG